MGYGVISSSILMASGLPPAVTSAAVHVTKLPTGIISGLSHWRLGNVDWAIFRRLLLPGFAGSALGAAIVSFAPVALIRPVIAGYLSLMALLILFRLIRRAAVRMPRGTVAPVGFFGGLFDSAGGGWGPIVTSSLIGQGHEPRRAIGSTNSAEPVIAAFQTLMFSLWLGVETFAAAGAIALAIVAGALCAAPFAARLVSRMPPGLTMAVVGLVLLALNLPVVLKSLF